MALSRVLCTPELLRQIFEDCLPDIIFLRNTPLDAPLFLTQVCRTWREIAISNGRLWTSFRLDCKKHTFEAVEDIGDVYPVLSEWLKRSGQRPFSLKVIHNKVEAWGRYMDVPPNASINKLLMWYRNRWERLDVGLPSTSVNIFHQALNWPSFPQLKILTFRDDFYNRNTPFRIGEAPKLHTLDLSSETTRWTTRLTSFPLDIFTVPPSVHHLSLTKMSLKMIDPHSTGRITRLSLSKVFITLDDFARLPDFFPRLEVLRVSLKLDRPVNGISVVFQNLRTLYTYNLTNFLMTHITAPNLKNLFIEDVLIFEPHCTIYFSDIISFLKRSQPPLQSIQIQARDMEMTHEEFVVFFDMVPNLEELEIVDTLVSTTSLMALTLPVEVESSGTTRYLCPRLLAVHFNRVTVEKTSVTEPSSLVPLVRALLATRCMADPSAKIRHLEYIGLPLDTDELKLLQGECRLLCLETKIYSTLTKNRSW